MKNKAFRIAQRQRIIKKRLKLVKSTESSNIRYSDGKTRFEKLSETPNIVNKKHPNDCGKSGCLLCHREKIFKKGELKKKQVDLKNEDLENPLYD